MADDGTIYTPGQEYGMRPVDVRAVFPRETASVFSSFSSRILISLPRGASSRTFVSFRRRLTRPVTLQLLLSDSLRLTA